MEHMIGWLALAVALVGAVLGLMALVKNRGNVIKISELEDSIKKLSNELAIVDDVSQGLGNRVADMKTGVAALSELATAMPVDMNSEEAIIKASGLLEQGVELEQVAAECGLPIGEVRLMEAMRRSKNVELDPEPLL